MSQRDPGRRRAGTAAGTRRQNRREPDDAGHVRYRSRSESEFRLPPSVLAELRAAGAAGAAGADPLERRSSSKVPGRPPARSAADLEQRLGAAARAYRRDRYEEALSALRPVLEHAPSSAAAKELYGLTLYRMGRWRQAEKQLRQLYELTGSYDQHPVIADCERALGHLDKVRTVFDEMRTQGVDREVLVEGRLVMAGALADAGLLAEATAVLVKDARKRRNPDLGHLREWYVLADLFERAGDLPRARELFSRVAVADPDGFDAGERLAALC
ncbi:MAG: tetratricopeptide repeat protein [Acidimicrobiales bacterium]